MNPLYPAIAERADNRCEYCRAPELVFNDLFEVEHIVPVSQGGSDDTTNLALACRSCNNTQVQTYQKRISGPLLDCKFWGM